MIANLLQCIESSLIGKISAMANWACKNSYWTWKSNNGASSYCHQMKTKNKLVDFIVEQWISNSSLISDKILIVTNNTEAYKISNNCILILELESNHKEADSQMMLHVKHPSRTYSSVVIHTPQTNFFIIAFLKIMEFDC